eukprot:Pgem_evm1s13805
MSVAARNEDMSHARITFWGKTAEELVELKQQLEKLVESNMSFAQCRMSILKHHETTAGERGD